MEKHEDKNLIECKDESSVESLLYKCLEKIERFPVGSPFSTKTKSGEVRFGWVIGYAMNPFDELVFKIKWAHRDEEKLLHPTYVHDVSRFANE